MKITKKSILSMFMVMSGINIYAMGIAKQNVLNLQQVVAEHSDEEEKVRWERNKKITRLLLDRKYANHVLKFLGGYAKQSLDFSQDQALIPSIVVQQGKAIIESVQSHDYECLKKSCILLDAYRSLFYLSDPTSSHFVQSSSDFIKNNGHSLFFLVLKGIRLDDGYRDGGDDDKIATSLPKHAIDIVKLLLDRGVNINVQDTDKKTLLHYAARYGEIDLVSLLLARGASVDIKNKYGKISLHNATRCPHVKIIQLLLDRGADVHARDDIDRTPLCDAARGGRIDIAKLLLDYGADIHVKDKDNMTPLRRAINYENTELAQFLIDYGADLDL